MDKRDPPLQPRSKLPDFTPFIVIAAVLGLLALGLYLFPVIKSAVNYQDCVASGRTDCAVRT